MKMKRYFNKKILAVLLCLSMVLNITPLSAIALTTEDALCEHHTEHTADCGYVAAVEGSPCTHVCGEACVESCVHSAHDDTCGYIAGIEGTPCAYDCQEDHGTVTDQPEATTEPSVPETTEDAVPETTEGETVPETTEGETVIANQSSDWCGNPLCSQEDAFHVTSCDLYVAPENPQCFCVEKCTEPNVWCDVCGFDYTQCGGTDTAAVYTDCAHTTVTDGICTECQMYGWCGATGSESSVTWAFDETTGTLTISGTGAMADYEQNTTTYNSTAPWIVYTDSIEQVIVEDGITSIGSFAFLNCELIEEVKLADSIEIFKIFAFCYCDKLKEVALPANLKEIEMGAFLQCYSLESIKWNTNLTTIGSYGFADCGKLESIVLPSGVTSIGEHAFEMDGVDDPKLKYVEIPANVTSIGYCAFYSEALKTVCFLGKNKPATLHEKVFIVIDDMDITVLVPCTYSSEDTTFGGAPVVNGHFEAVTGNSNLTYSVSGNSIVQYCNHCQTTATATLKIAENKVYDGTNKVSVDYTDGWLGGNLDVMEAIQPGTYTASISFGDLTVSETFEIVKNQLTITAKDQTIAYGESIALGADQVNAVLGTGDTLTITLTPSTDKATDNGKITPSDAKITNASGVDVTDNYIITYATGKLIINKSEPVITFNAEYTPSKTYDGNAVEEPTVEDVTVTGIYEAPVVFIWYKDSVSEAKKLSAAPTDSGTYILVASIAETSNTGATSIELNVTISQAEASVTEAPKVVSGLIYTGDPQELVSGGEAQGGKLVYSTTQDGTYAETITGTDAGSYEVWYKVRGDANHTDNEPVKLSIIEIAQADASDAVVTITGTYSYTSVEIIPAEDEVTVTLGGKTLIYDTDYTFTSSNNIEVGTDTAIVTVTFKGNYTGTATGTFTIAECPHNKFEDKKCTQCGGICGVVNKHSYTNGICVNGCYQPAEDSDSDGYYEIGNAGQLFWFAQQVNSGSTSMNAVLTANIVMPTKKSWTPIGTIDSQYAGIFDGKNHTISGLYYNDSNGQYIGLFGRVYNGTVRNVGVLNVDFLGQSSVGGIAGYAGSSTIENCFVTGTIDGTGTLGGVVGAARAGAKLKNCYDYTNVGNVTGDGTRATITNCYYLADSDTHDDSLTGTTAKTAAQFASGEVAYLLNGSTSEGDLAWGQTIGTQTAPTLGGDKVYQVTGCDHSTTVYSNTNENGAHNYVNGKCTICGHTIELISVDITWGAMEFTYTDGAWNPESHSYEDGAWTSDSGTITVVNSGNVAVTAELTYNPNNSYATITGSFTSGGTPVTELTLPVDGEQQTATLILSGTPEAEFTGAELGIVTVTVKKTE